LTEEHLCTIEDILKEAPDLNGIIEEEIDNIEYKIIDISERIWEFNPTLTRNDLNARLATVYGVLAWLEKRGLIQRGVSGGVAAIREGDIEIKYASRSGERFTDSHPPTYNEEYQKYLARIYKMRFIIPNKREDGGE